MKKEKELILDSHKLEWHGDRVKAWLDGERIAPITMDVALTRICNYNCSYCFGKLQENVQTTLSKDAVFSFLDDAAEIGVKAVSLISDGESTCSPFVYDAITRGKSNGLDMALGTNGALLKLDKLKKMLPALTYLRFNISAGEPERYKEIHGCKEGDFEKVQKVIRKCTRIKKQNDLETTIGLQMVLLPDFLDQVMPLAKLGKELGVDYLVIKHCSDSPERELGIDYEKYLEKDLTQTLKQAEAESTSDYLVKAKWSKILDGSERIYDRCYGPQFIMQFSGSGLVAPCGMLFNNKYKRYHIGNIAEQSFKEIWQGEKYWEVMNFIASNKFDIKKTCATLCLQHKVNEYLWKLKQGEIELREPEGAPPQHVNFI